MSPIKLNNCWTVYREEAENGQRFCEIGRPQDWGAPRWMHRIFTVTANLGGQDFQNTVHIWHEGKVEEYQLTQESAGLLVMFLQPGYPVPLSGVEYLDEDDFWEQEWGKMPPVYKIDTEEDF